MKNKGQITKLEIIKVASRMFLEYGYSKTTIRAICKQLDISPGHLMFYFPSKEYLLAEVVDILCDFQWELIKRVTNEGASQLMAVCFEMTTMASACEESEIAKDFYISSYTPFGIISLIIMEFSQFRCQNIIIHLTQTI